MASYYRPLLLTLAICSIIVAVVSGQTWVTVTLTEADVPTLDYSFSGRELEPLISGLVVVPIAGIFGLMAAKGIFQRLVGLLVFICGTAIGYLAISIDDKWNTYVENLISNKLGRGGIDFTMQTNSLGPALIAPAVGIAIVGLIFTIRNFDSAKKRAAYDIPATGVASLTPWQALDAGYDPTISVTEGGSGNSFGSGSS